MARLITLQAALLIAGTSFASPPQTEIVVIGTVHDPTPAYTSDTLVGILQAVKPDVVLLEGDPRLFDGYNGLKSDHRNSLEGSAAYRYQQMGGPPPQPFDIEGRDVFYQQIDYYKNQTALLAKINSLYTAGALSPEAKTLFEVAGAFSEAATQLMQDRPEVINSAASDALMKQKQRYIFEGIGRIIAISPELKEFAAYWEKDRTFWHLRNKTMVENILSHAKKRGTRRRIAVLCGFEHRNHIITGLSDHARSENLSIREYWSQDAQPGVPAEDRRLGPIERGEPHGKRLGSAKR